MAQHTNVEIRYNGRTDTIDLSQVVDSKYQVTDDENKSVIEYFIFNAAGIESATITYDTGSDDEDWDSSVRIEIVSIYGPIRTYAFKVTAPFNDSLSEPSRTISINGVMHVTTEFGPDAECDLSFTVKNNCNIFKIDYKLSEDADDDMFLNFFEKNAYGEYYSNSDYRSNIYKIVSRYCSKSSDGKDADYDYYSYLADNDMSIVSLGKRYRVQRYAYQDFYFRIVDKENSYNIGPGLRSYGNSTIDFIENVYNADSRQGSLFFTSPLHAIGYRAFSFSYHNHEDGCGNPSYFDNIEGVACNASEDIKIGPFGESGDSTENQKEYTSSVNDFLEEIYLPKEVKIIGNQAFKYNANLKKVSFASSDTLKVIGMFAFESCSSLSSITLPSTVKQIGEGAFKRSGLKSFDAPRDLGMIEAGTFDKCASLSAVNLSNSSIKKIGRFAFRGCASNYDDGFSITFNNSLEQIAHGAFRGYSNGTFKFKTDITFPSSLKSIGTSAFKHCSLKKVKWVDNTATDGLKIEGRAFSYVDVDEIEFPEGFNGIGSYAFFALTCNTLTFRCTTCPEPIDGADKFFSGVSDRRVIRNPIKVTQSFYDDVIAKMGANRFAHDMKWLFDTCGYEIIS